jgi:hypothetical protein
MNEETFNMSIRKFLKMVGVRSQTEIERAVAKAIADGQLKGNESLPASMTLTIDKLALRLTLDGEIRLE